MDSYLAAGTFVNKTVHIPFEATIMVTQHPSLPHFIFLVLHLTLPYRFCTPRDKTVAANSLVNTLNIGAMMKTF